MFTNRITRFFVDAEPARETNASTFAALPSFAKAQPTELSISGPSVYQIAWQQAQQQVEAKRRREESTFDWN